MEKKSYDADSDIDQRLWNVTIRILQDRSHYNKIAIGILCRKIVVRNWIITILTAIIIMLLFL